MKILVDDRWFGDTGIGRYAREILKRKPDNHQATYLEKNWKISNPASPWLLGGAIKRSCADLFWSPGFMPPALCKIPYVVTMHDLIHLHYGTRLHKLYYNQIISRLLRDAAMVLTVSAYSREEILEWSGLPDDRVKAIPLAVSRLFAAEGAVYRLGFPYVLYVGNRRVYKNIPRLIKAFGSTCQSHDVKLALSGDEDSSLLALARQVGIADRIVFLGKIKEDDVPAVYRGALAVAYVSLCEGFGLPPLEAMACGTPVITSNITSMPEVVNGSALMVNPTSVDEIADGITRIIEDAGLRCELVKRGLERVKSFSWDMCAEKTWDALQQAAWTLD